MPMLFVQQSCSVTLSGASIPDDMKTLSVQFFENSAPLVVPYLSQQFTETLKDRIRSQTRLSLVRTEGDANFEGRITDYSVAPAAVEANNRAGLNRLTVTVNVKYTNTKDPDLSFEQSFSVFREFAASGSLASQEKNLIPEINKQLAEDIFNRAFANW